MTKTFMLAAALAAFGAQASSASLQCHAVPNIGAPTTLTVTLTYQVGADGKAKPTGYLKRSGPSPYSEDYSVTDAQADNAAWQHLKACSGTPGTKGVHTVEFPALHAGVPPVIDAWCTEPGATKCKPKVV